jgi:hypothetical protein
MRFMMVFMVFFCVSAAYANNLFIPNYYKNRRTNNQYSAIGWSHRNETGLVVQSAENKVSRDGVEESNEDSLSFTAHYYHRLNETFNLEISGDILDADGESITPAYTQNTDRRTISSALGYQFEQVPMAIGLSFGITQTDFETSLTGTKFESDVDDFNFGVGYKLASDIYFGVGTSLFKVDRSLGSDDNIQFHVLGLGKVYGGTDNPVAAVETYFVFLNEDGDKTTSWVLSGLINKNSFQYYGNISYSIEDSADDEKEWGLSLGVDYQFADFYVGPQFSIGQTGYDSDREDSVFGASLQAGYRTSMLEFYIRYNMDEDEVKSAGSKNVTEDSVVSIAGIYKF